MPKRNRSSLTLVKEKPTKGAKVAKAGKATPVKDKPKAQATPPPSPGRKGPGGSPAKSVPGSPGKGKHATTGSPGKGKHATRRTPQEDRCVWSHTQTHCVHPPPGGSDSGSDEGSIFQEGMNKDLAKEIARRRHCKSYLFKMAPICARLSSHDVVVPHSIA